jgi:hypothetical protein
MTPKHPPGPPMTLGNMRELRVRRSIALCLGPGRWLSSMLPWSLQKTR